MKTMINVVMDKQCQAINEFMDFTTLNSFGAEHSISDELALIGLKHEQH